MRDARLRRAMRAAAALVCATIGVAPASAQVSDAFRHAVPRPTPADAELSLSLADAVQRGLDANLGIILEQERLKGVEGLRLRQLSALLPHASFDVRQTVQKVNLAAFGFTGFPGVPQVIGPFGVFDARVGVSAPIFDASARAEWRSARALVDTATHSAKQARETVVLVVSSLYLEAIADAARVEAARSQVETADALARLATDQKTGGLIAGIDVLRQQVQLESARARLIASENNLANDTLSLARAIGLPAMQKIALSDRPVFTPTPALDIDAIVDAAARTREDLKTAEARVDAARAARQSAAGGALPTFRIDADIAAVGSSASTAARTFDVAASVRVPLFDGGITRGKVQQADAELRAREAELADLRTGVRFEVLAAVHDMTAADARVVVARSAEGLARQQLEQAQDRFRAGVASTIELVQAEESLAAASEQLVSSVHAHALAKAGLARATGQVEARFKELVGGQK